MNQENYTNQEYKTQKAFSIVESIVNTAIALNKQAVIAFPKKKPRILNKHTKHYRLRRKIRNFAEMQLYIIPLIGSTQLHLIASQPIPKFKLGTNAPTTSEAIVYPHSKPE